MKTLSVIAPPGRICPKEGGLHKGKITDSQAVTVPSTAYYRRLLREGSLVHPDAQPAAPAVKKGGK